MLQTLRQLNQTRVIGQYQLKAIVGAGGMGTVYRAYQPALKRQVAVKILPLMLASETGYIERFNREAETAASLEHPHIVPVYDFGTQRGISYVVMRLLPGGSLANRLDAAVAGLRLLPSPQEIALVLDQLGSALDYAHSRGVIHRDIKPGNVLFDAHGGVYLADFGIAHLVNSTHAMTTTGIALGTPNYMAPEQWRDEEVTPATDQYALGVMLYQALTGRVPFEASTPFGLMHKHLHEIPQPPHMAREDLPPAISIVLGRAMAKIPAHRYPSTLALAEDFRVAASAHPGRASGLFKPAQTLKLAGLETPLLVPLEGKESGSGELDPAPTRRPGFLARRLGGALLFAFFGLALGVGIFALTQSQRGSPQALPLSATETVQSAQTDQPGSALLIGSPTATSTSRTATLTPSATPTPTHSTTISATARATATATPRATLTRTPSHTRTAARTSTRTPSRTWTPVRPTAAPIQATTQAPPQVAPTQEPPPLAQSTPIPPTPVPPTQTPMPPLTEAPPPTQAPTPTSSGPIRDLVNTLLPPLLGP